MNRHHPLLPALLVAAGLAAAGHAQAAPVLASLSVDGVANARKPDSSITVHIAADDAVGVQAAYVYICGPGSSVRSYGENGPPLFYLADGDAPTHLVADFQIGPERAYTGFHNTATGPDHFLSRWSRPSTPAHRAIDKWRVCGLTLLSLDGTGKSYREGDPDSEDLSAFPQRTFRVVNTLPDLVPPEATEGAIVTPTVSLSGTNPWVKAALTVDDPGDPAYGGFAAGIDRIVMTFCLPPVDENGVCSDGFSIDHAFGTPQTGPVTGIAGGVPTSIVDPAHGPVTPGTYTLGGILILGTSATSAVYTNSAIYTPGQGGTTDFSTIFPTTTVTITP